MSRSRKLTDVHSISKFLALRLDFAAEQIGVSLNFSQTQVTDLPIYRFCFKMASSTEDDRHLEALNDENVYLMIPVIVYIAVLMVTGSIGNILVCVYYGCKTRFNTNSLFIISLAVFDLIVCMFTMPIEIVNMRFFYKFVNGVVCKSARLFNHFAANGSATVLLVIAVDRYRRICRPLRPQLEMKQAKIAVFGAGAVSLVLSWPAAILYELVPENITDSSDNTTIIVTASICTTVEDDLYRSYLWVFYGIQFVLFTGSSIILFTLYTLVGREIFKFKKRRITYRSSRRNKDGSDSHGNTETSITEIHKDTVDQKEEIELQSNGKKPDIETNGKIQDIEANEKINNNLSGSSSTVSQTDDKHSKGSSQDSLSIRYTIQMLFVAVIYVLSYLPYIGLVTWRIFEREDDSVTQDDTKRLWFNMGVRSYLLNSAANPIVYGFFNEYFRRFLGHCCLCKRLRNK